MTNTFKDPVCGADLTPQDGTFTAEYQGTTFYFCCPGCKKVFEAEPEKYLSQAAPAHNHACC